MGEGEEDVDLEGDRVLFGGRRVVDEDVQVALHAEEVGRVVGV